MKKLEEHTHQSRQRLSKRRQAEMIEAGKERSRERRKKKLVSNTNAGVEFRDKYLDAVNEQILAMLAPYDAQGRGNKPKWYKAIKSVNTKLTAGIAINSFIDAAQKGLSMTAAREQTGKVFVALLFDQLCYGTPEREKAFKRFKQAMMHKLGDTYRRTDLFLARADSLGFDTKKYANRNMLINIGSALQDCVTMAGILDWQKFKKSDDTHRTRYLRLSDAVMEYIEDRNDRHFDLQSPMLSAKADLPNKWYQHEDGWSCSGAYDDKMLNFQLHLVRHMGEEQRQEVEERIESGKLDKVLEAVHTIQETPYIINEYVLKAVQWVTETDVSAEVGSFPNLVEVEVVKRLPKEQWADMSTDEKTEWRKDENDKIAANFAAKANLTMLKRYTAPKKYDRQNEPYGEAEKLLEDGIFYMPHNCDNRGRIYHINDFGHHDTDYCRAMFNFANTWEVTEDNIQWLYLQLVNTYGNQMDKLTIDLHHDFFENNEADILACGEDFTKSFGIWSQADDPFQFLATCREIYLAKTAWANGETYESGLPIAVDASQSGVQHLALSLLDKDNCVRVNLSDTKQRHDIYEDCLVYAKQLFVEDKADREAWLKDDPVQPSDRIAAVEFRKQLEAKTDDGKFVLTGAARKRFRRQWNRSDERKRLKWENELDIIDRVTKQMNAAVLPYGRKVIKRNVMTFCYSSRQFGFADQLRSDWMDKMSEKVRLGKLPDHPFGADKGFAASIYLANVHERAIRKIVNAAEIGMDFMQDCTAILARYGMPTPTEIEEERGEELTEEERREATTYNPNGVHLRFLTPIMNFPMYQNYIKVGTKEQELTFYDKPLEKRRKEWLTIHDEEPELLWVEKSGNACAPNLVHAMDATHLMMTVLECKKQGVTDIMVVHDSFATGIGNMELLWDALRSTLVELYRDYNLYQDLLDQCKQRLAAHLLAQGDKSPAEIDYHIENEIDWPTVPERGDFDINEVYGSTYSFL